MILVEKAEKKNSWIINVLNIIRFILKITTAHYKYISLNILNEKILSVLSNTPLTK